MADSMIGRRRYWRLNPSDQAIPAVDRRLRHFLAELGRGAAGRARFTVGLIYTTVTVVTFHAIVTAVSPERDRDFTKSVTV